MLYMYGEKERHGLPVWAHGVQYLWRKSEKLSYVSKTDHQKDCVVLIALSAVKRTDR